MWRPLNNLHVSEERLHRHKSQSPVCKLCEENAVDNIWNHSFSVCAFSAEAMDWMVGGVKKYDRDITKEKVIFLQLNPPNCNDVLPCVWIIVETLQYIWSKRRSKQPICVNEMKDSISVSCAKVADSETFKVHAAKMRLVINNS